jgi:hypothetical protein
LKVSESKVPRTQAEDVYEKDAENAGLRYLRARCREHRLKMCTKKMLKTQISGI